MIVSEKRRKKSSLLRIQGHTRLFYLRITSIRLDKLRINLHFLIITQIFLNKYQ